LILGTWWCRRGPAKYGLRAPKTERDAVSGMRRSAIIVESREQGADMHPNEALARREIDLIETGDLEALDDLYAPDLVVLSHGAYRARTGDLRLT
jgi:hypothetical protein